MLSLDENQIYLYTSSLSGILAIRSNQIYLLNLIIYGKEKRKKAKKSERLGDRG
jgi:hypothetical protein